MSDEHRTWLERPSVYFTTAHCSCGWKWLGDCGWGCMDDRRTIDKAREHRRPLVER